MRDKWKCVDCGIETSGRVDERTGLVHASDKSGDRPGPPRPSLCFPCDERRKDRRLVSRCERGHTHDPKGVAYTIRGGRTVCVYCGEELEL